MWTLRLPDAAFDEAPSEQVHSIQNSLLRKILTFVALKFKSWAPFCSPPPLRPLRTTSLMNNAFLWPKCSEPMHVWLRSILPASDPRTACIVWSSQCSSYTREHLCFVKFLFGVVGTAPIQRMRSKHVGRNVVLFIFNSTVNWWLNLSTERQWRC